MLKEKINLKKLDELTKNNPLSYEVMVYDVNKGRRKVMKSKTSKKKYTLNQVGETVDKLGSRVDQLTITVDKLAKFTYEGFKHIDARLDYIVKANKLKDLPKTNK